MSVPWSVWSHDDVVTIVVNSADLLPWSADATDTRVKLVCSRADFELFIKQISELLEDGGGKE
jgi:hypothetical protein